MIKVDTVRTSEGLQHSTVNALYVQADPGSKEYDDDPEYHMLFHINMYLHRGR